MNDQDPTEENSEEELTEPSSGEETAPGEAQEEQPQTEEEPKRDRSAEGRIARLTAKNKQLERDLEQEREVRSKQPVPTPTVPDKGLTPEEIQAKTLLKDRFEFADKETLTQEMRSLENRLVLDLKHTRLEESLDGSDGRPKYDRGEVEDYMRSRGDIFNPEVAYRELYRDELIDFEIKKATSGKKSRPYTAQPTSSRPGDEGAITRELVAKKLAAKDTAWLAKNRDTIRALGAEGKL